MQRLMVKLRMKTFRLMGLVVVLAVMGLAWFGAAPRALADDPNNVNVAAETELVREGLDQAMRAYRLGSFADAYKLSRAAYLDHFENIEVKLRPSDSALTTER